jgi:hypothetical protein
MYLNHSRLCQQYLNDIFPRHIQIKKKSINQIAHSYGEILFQSMDKIIQSIPFNDQDIFIDYGSGLGKIAAQVFLSTPAKAVYGLEIELELYESSIQSAHHIKTELPEFYYPNRTLEFIHGNFLSHAITNATIIMVASPCFGLSMIDQLAKRFDEQPNLRYLISLRPLDQMKKLSFKKIIPVQGTWDKALCYIYAR